MTEEEIFYFMFTNKDGKEPRFGVCPCTGLSMKTDSGVRLHHELCEVFLKHLPHLVHGSVIIEPYSRALTPNEQSYLKKVLKRRLPQYIWVEDQDNLYKYKIQAGIEPKKTYQCRKPQDSDSEDESMSGRPYEIETFDTYHQSREFTGEDEEEEF